MVRSAAHGSALTHNCCVCGFYPLCLCVRIFICGYSARAIQGDLVPDFQQHAVQSASVVMGSVGDLSVQALLNYFDEPVAHIRFAFLVIGTIFMVTIVTLLVAAKEVPVEEDDEGLARANQQSLNVLTYMRGLPPWLWSTGAIYSGGFFTLFCTLPNASSWLGSTVLHGKSWNTAHGGIHSALL